MYREDEQEKHEVAVCNGIPDVRGASDTVSEISIRSEIEIQRESHSTVGVKD